MKRPTQLFNVTKYLHHPIQIVFLYEMVLDLYALSSRTEHQIPFGNVANLIVISYVSKLPLNFGQFLLKALSLILYYVLV